ncbi:hypothetical protein [Polyangium mundeleinium]|uniref:Lipoprotein n=1 Tax=Polyangium mundeleinium TaxID=2995306 RepID=A0ABT5ETF4_9BACT|nr:hypothetical protein [Polyangium mundeleinium]MDC0744629.1 hypothetical protein [Polyangium mundeleinium]
MALLCFLALPACSSERDDIFSRGGNQWGGNGDGGGSASSASSSSSGGGGGAPCDSSPGMLSFHGVRTSTSSGTKTMVSGKYGIPYDNQLSAEQGEELLWIDADDVGWSVTLLLHLEAAIDPPLTITRNTVPHYVYDACFNASVAPEDRHCGDETFEVTVNSLSWNRIQGTFKGRTIAEDGSSVLDVDAGAFDVPIVPAPGT